MKIKNYSKSNHSFSYQFNKTSIIAILILAITINVIGQEKSNTIDDSLISDNSYLHNLQLEKFFLHTNKTSYFPGEKVWFKAYVVNDTDNKPSLSTSNLHINLYDSQKKLISSNLFLTHEGKADGQIELSKELISGKYYLEVTTQWNQNFDNNSAISSIDIISPNQNNSATSYNEIIVDSSTSNEIENNLSIQFFPEGSAYLENVKNTIAFSANNNSAPISISGDIIDNTTGIIIAKMESNTYGLGSFDVFMRSERTYTASIEFNGSTYQYAIPKPEQKGFLVVKNEKESNNTSLNFILKTNDATLKSIKNKNLAAILHRNGMTNIVVPIKLKKGILNYSFNLRKEDLFNGINSITVFNKSNTPISDYSFFYENKNNIQLEITKAEEDKDSITLNLGLKNELSKANLSISILPEETKVYENNTSINTAFLLSPYLNNTILNLSKIISSSNNERMIDLLIATNIKKNLFPYKDGDKITPTENGIKIKGNVSANIQDLTDYKVMLSSTESGILLIEPIGDSNSFSFDNIILKHPSKYKLALLDSQGKIIKTGFRMSNNLISYKANATLSKNIDLLQQENNIGVDTEMENIDLSLLPLVTNDVNLLDEVKLSKKQKKENKLRELGISENILENEFSRLYPIDEKESAMSIVDYFQRIAGIKVINDCPLYISIRSSRGSTSFMGVTKMSIFIDGNRIDDTVFLCSMKASEFIALSTNSLGAGAGLQGEGGILNLYTRKGKFNNYSSIPNEDIVISETDFGFSISETNFENSILQFINSDSRKFYGAVGWFPNIDIIPNSTYQLKLHKNEYKDFKVIVNGMNDDGKLVYKVVNINSDML